MGGDFIWLFLAIAGGFGVAFWIWKTWLVKDPFRNHGVSRWSGFRKKTEDEMDLDQAYKALAQGSFGIAEKHYRSLLERLPDHREAHLGLADCLFEQSLVVIKTDPVKKIEALGHYRFALDSYLKENQSPEAVALYTKILGPYGAEEIGSHYKTLLSPHASQTGDLLVHDETDLPKLLKKLQTEFDDFEAEQKYSQAYAVVKDILKKFNVSNLDPGLLAQAGDVCLRVGDLDSAGKLLEWVAQRGDLKQTVRALSTLSRFWLKTQKQITLTFLYKNSLVRFPDIVLYREWGELGKKLKE